MSRSVILVTGGAGFIGSNIVSALAQRYDVAVCDVLGAAENGKWRNLSKHPIVDFVAPDHLWAWLARRGEAVEAVVHMGAISSTTEPDADLIVHTNFGLSRDLWDWCAAHKRRLIYASSAATYGDGEGGFVDADDIASLKALRPLNAYGWSKALFDVYARREADRGHAPPHWAGLKFFNVYGPNEHHKGAMRSVACQMWPKVVAGEPVRLFKSHRPDYADGGQLRDFVHVDDVVSVVEWLLENASVSGIFNVGSGEARSFADLARAVFDAAGQPPRIDYFEMPEALRERYQYFTQADLTRLRGAGYSAPFRTLEDGVRSYVADHLSRQDPYR